MIASMATAPCTGHGRSGLSNRSLSGLNPGPNKAVVRSGFNGYPGLLGPIIGETEIQSPGAVQNG